MAIYYERKKENHNLLEFYGKFLSPVPPLFHTVHGYGLLFYGSTADVFASKKKIKNGDV